MDLNIMRVNHQEAAIAREILFLQKRSYKIEAEIINFSDIPPLKEDVETLMTSKEQYFCGYVEAQIVGVLALEKELGESYCISKLFIHPEFFRKNIGSRLIQYICNQLTPNTELRVSTPWENKPAANLYQSHGFKEIKQTIVNEQLRLVHFKKIL